MGELELAAIAARLYALPFDDFVAARTAAAKDVAAAGTAAEVRSLSKPSVAAWTVNMFAAKHPGTLRELAALGQSMRSAQSALDAVELRRLSQERRRMLSRAVKEARLAAEQQGRKVSAAVAAEVEETLRAATADEGAAVAVQSGRLLRALSADGVDVVDLAGAVALPGLAGPALFPAPPEVPPRPSPQAGAPPANESGQPRLRAVRQEPRRAAPSALERARTVLQEAEQTARQAAEEAGRHEEQLAAATKLTTGLAEAARALRAQLEEAELDLKSARRRQELAAAQAQQSVRASDKARRKEDLARERVLRLGNTPE